MKKISALIASSLLVVLAACSSPRPEPKSSTSGEDNPAAKVQLGSFESKVTNINLAVNETKQLEVFVFPSAFQAKNIRYISSDPEIVSISSDGKMTAKKAGFAKITVSCGTFSSMCYVTSGEKVDFENAEQKASLLQRVKDTKAIQEDASFAKTDYLKIKEKSSGKITRKPIGDEHAVASVDYQSLWYEDMIISKEDAYFSIVDTFDSKIRTANGGPTYSTSGWLFYCTESFETFIFHDSNEGKKYMVIDCSAHTDRYAALTEVLGNIFTNITDIIAGQFDNINTTDEVEMMIDCLEHEYTNVTWDSAYLGDEENKQLVAKYSLIFNNELIDAEMSSNMGIPSGVIANINQAYESYFDNGYMQFQNIDYSYVYDYRGNTVTDTTLIERTYKLEKETLRYPDIEKEGYKEAEDIFEL